MPRRPRQHVSETESRRAFENAVPAEWVFRGGADDYGIDGEVEIFEGGKATGRVFKVQLKSTDGDRLAVRLPIEKETYYFSLNLPILVVLYHRPTDRIFARWFQSFDPHYGGRTEKAITLRFTEQDQWNASTPDRLRADVEAFFRLRDPRRVLPLEFSLEAIAKQVAGAPAATVAAEARSLLMPLNDIVRVTAPGSEGSEGRIVLDEDRIVVDLRSMATVTLHYSDTQGETRPTAVAHDVGMALALLLARFAIHHAAARLLGRFVEGSRIASSSDMAPVVTETLVQAGRLQQALTFVEWLATNHGEDAEVAAAIAEVPIMMRASTLPSDEQEQVLAYLRRRVDAALERGAPSAAAAAHCNVGRWLRRSFRHSEALEHYAEALRLDPDYERRGYFHAERAGSLFETGQYKEAAEKYGQAIASGENGRLRAQLADALMMSGEFAKADETFQEFNAETEEPNPEWRLKEWALGTIRARVGDVQSRRVDDAERLADVSEPSLTDAQRRTRLEQALDADALCAPAWFNLGLLEGKEERIDLAFTGFLVAALIVRHALEPWVRAIVLALGHPDETLLQDAVRTAYLFNRDEFVTEMSKVASELPDISLRERLQATLEAAIAAGLPTGGPFQFRILEEGGSYEVITIPSTDEDEA